MDTPELSRPDLFAHREALRLPASKVVEKLVEIVGRKLTAYIGASRTRVRSIAGSPAARSTVTLKAGCGSPFRWRAP